jgi:hypothetical protein
LARNRYGWEKRSKELARKQKNDEKMKRRQGKAPETAEAETPEVVEELGLSETDPTSQNLPQDS